eukprot:TRINITY_DN6411_c0_g1_i1.p1 TRINITY_DN6411_c0_g1~~TRINITY_DN6411_c0_g1_i1.p1  ORF type:complete len:586 (+),score=158.05 TRINITY_DN6411_c0_g1_i1:28-1785(+)
MSVPPPLPSKPPPLPSKPPPKSSIPASLREKLTSNYVSPSDQVPPPIPTIAISESDDNDSPAPLSPSTDGVPESPSNRRSMITRSNAVRGDKMKNLGKEVQNLVKRGKVIDEVIQTEKAYVGYLQYATEYLYKPLQNLKLLEPAVMEIVFSNLIDVLQVNQQLLGRLRQEMPLDQLIPVFAEMESQLRPIYAQYCGNQDSAISTLGNLKQNKEFNAFCEDAKNNVELSGRLHLSDYIIKPVQRVLKYPLFFREMMKYTMPDDPLRPQIDDLIDKYEQLSLYINERAAHQYMAHRLAQIDAKINANSEKPVAISTQGRELLLEGSFTVVSKKKSKEMVFLFNDSVLFTDLDQSQFKRMLFLDEFTDIETEVVIGNRKGFSIVDRNGKEPRVYGFIPLDEKQRIKWTETLNSVKLHHTLDLITRRRASRDEDEKRRTLEEKRTSSAPATPRGRPLSLRLNKIDVTKLAPVEAGLDRSASLDASIKPMSIPPPRTPLPPSVLPRPRAPDATSPSTKMMERPKSAEGLRPMKSEPLIPIPTKKKEKEKSKADTLRPPKSKHADATPTLPTHNNAFMNELRKTVKDHQKE